MSTRAEKKVADRVLLDQAKVAKEDEEIRHYNLYLARQRRRYERSERISAWIGGLVAIGIVLTALGAFGDELPIK